MYCNIGMMKEMMSKLMMMFVNMLCFLFVLFFVLKLFFFCVLNFVGGSGSFLFLSIVVMCFIDDVNVLLYFFCLRLIL